MMKAPPPFCMTGTGKRKKNPKPTALPDMAKIRPILEPQDCDSLMHCQLSRPNVRFRAIACDGGNKTFERNLKSKQGCYWFNQKGIPLFLIVLADIKLFYGRLFLSDAKWLKIMIEPFKSTPNICQLFLGGVKCVLRKHLDFSNYRRGFP